MTVRRSGGICEGPLSVTVFQSKTNGYGILHGVFLQIMELGHEYPLYSFFLVGASKNKNTLKVMSNQGTQLELQSPVIDEWLAAIQAGLELALIHPEIRPSQIELPEPEVAEASPRTRGGFFRSSSKTLRCRGCGVPGKPTRPIPFIKSGETRQLLCEDCIISFGLIDFILQRRTVECARAYEQDMLQSARDLCDQVSLDMVGSNPLFLKCAKIVPRLQQNHTWMVNHEISEAEFLESFVEEPHLELKQAGIDKCGDVGMTLQYLLTSTQNKEVQLVSKIIDYLSTLEAVEFVWPQLCAVHLRLLGENDARSLGIVQKLEAFLLERSLQSVQLGLETMWYFLADLEEAMTNQDAKQRKFPVLLFLVRLESAILGESVLRCDSILLNRLWKNKIDFLQTTFEASFPSPTTTPDAKEKLRQVQNAEYYTSHITFSRRLSDVAEHLHTLDNKSRVSYLETALAELNGSGALGGDPLNRKTESLIRVVRVPHSEGHVFRSKERAPVLLVMELIDENQSAEEEADGEPVVLEGAESKLSLSPGTSTYSSIMSSQIILNSALQRKPSMPRDDIERMVRNLDDDDLLVPAAAGKSESLNDDDGGASNGDMKADSEETRTTEAGETNEPDSDVVEVQSSESNGAEAAELVAGTTDEPTDNMIASGIESIEATEDPEENGVAGEAMDDTAKIDNTSKHTEETAVSEEQLEPQSEPIEEDLKQPSTPEPVPLIMSKSEESFRSSGADDGRRSSSRLLSSSGDMSDNDKNTLAPTGDIRRDVLNTIMRRGIEGNAIAAATSDSVTRSLQELERKRATELLLSDDDADTDSKAPSLAESFNELEGESTRQKLELLGLSQKLEEAYEASSPTDEDEVLEAIRLMLVQNQVAQGQLSPSDAVKVLQHTSLNPVNANSSQSFDPADIDLSDHPTIDAGDVDKRLVGCGPLPPAVLQAMTLWKGGMVTHAELLELVKKDIEFVKHSVLVGTDNVDNLKENSAFWARFSFGERWAEKKARLGNSSPHGVTPGWDITGVIVKANDDLRQEAFVMQLIELCKEAFEMAGLELWVSPYRILATGSSTGVIECVKNAMSFDALKKRPGYGRGGLRAHLLRMAEFTADPGETFRVAQQNFVRSLAAYSLISYFFMVKDRHNGNLLLDTAGHVIHIDFGFVFGIAPGGSFSLEMSTPFKLTEEMLDVMGGIRSPLFSEFVTLFCCGFLALQQCADTIVTLVEITAKESTFKCFDKANTDEVILRLRERFGTHMSTEETISFALDLIKQATSSFGTRQYDLYQYMSQGIVA